MTEKQSSKSVKAKLNLGEFFKGLFQRKKPVPAAESVEPEGQEEQGIPEVGGPARPRPATTAAITVSPEERVFQAIAVIGPSSGALHNMEQILLRRGYDVDYIPLTTRKRGAFEKHYLDHPVPPGCECIVLFEPESADQAKSALSDLRKQGNLPIVLVSRQVSNPSWGADILKQFDLTDRFLVRFSFQGLQALFRRIASRPTREGADDTQAPPARPMKPRPAPPPQAPPEAKPAPVQPPRAEERPESPPQPVLIETAPEPAEEEIEEKVEVLCADTARPMVELAPLVKDFLAQYRVEGKEGDGIDPARILTRREFERLFHPGFQERWRITRIQDPRATPPVLIEVKKLSGKQQRESPAETESSKPSAALPSPGTPRPAQKRKPLDLTDKIKEVRKRWQEGRLVKLCNDLEGVRKAFPDLKDIDQEAFLSSFVPLLEGTILFAKGRLDRTVETTLEEFFKEDFTRNGLQAPLRNLALLAVGREETYQETFELAEQSLSAILSKMLPATGDRERFNAAARPLQEYAGQLDELVEETLQLEEITPGVIYDYFDKLQRIIVHLHKTLSEIDPDFLIFGRLDQVILRSQTRSDWAFDYAKTPEEWQDRLRKFLRYLAEIRIETLRVRHELDLLIEMVDQGIAEAVTRIATQAPETETLVAETLERLDADHLQEPGNKTIWHIHRHRANYLIDLIHEEDPGIRAYATFDEENIVYSWLGIYQASPAPVKEQPDTEGEEEQAPEPSEEEEESPLSRSPEKSEKPAEP